MTFTRHSLLQLSATHVIKAYSGFLLCYVTRTLHYSLLFYSLRSLSSWVRSGFWFIFFPPFLLSIVCWVFLQFLPFFPSYFLVFFLLLFLTFHFFFFYSFPSSSHSFSLTPSSISPFPPLPLPQTPRSFFSLPPTLAFSEWLS